MSAPTAEQIVELINKMLAQEEKSLKVATTGESIGIDASIRTLQLLKSKIGELAE